MLQFLVHDISVLEIENQFKTLTASKTGKKAEIRDKKEDSCNNEPPCVMLFQLF